MKKTDNNIACVLAADLLLAYIVFMLCRVVFVVFNWPLLSAGWEQLSYTDLLVGSLLFDTSALCYLNALWAMMLLFPLHLKERRGWHTATRVVYVACNGLAVVTNLADTVYFQYTGRRTTSTVFNEFAGEDNLLSVFCAEVAKHWYIVLAGVLLIGLLWFLYRSPMRRGGAKCGVSKNKFPLRGYYVSHFVCLLLYACFTVVGMRGGVTTAVRPITVSNAGQYVNRPVEYAIVLNTPFSIIRTWAKTTFPIPAYFQSPKDLAEAYSPVHLPTAASETSTQERHPNIVVIIVESLGREYIGELNGTPTGQRFPSFTPFVDSLCRVGLTFDYSFCNGRKSIDAMPAILSGIPMFIEPFVLTPASLNRVDGLANQLGMEGYYSAFFHGAQNGSMGFQAFARSTGFNDYFGRDEYDADPHSHGDSDFDGTWAIWDEPFLQFFARTMNGFKQPFLASVFTASSHHPFNIPEQYRGAFTPDDNPMHRCARYADLSLRRFFETARTTPWYENTVFVLTSDHTNFSSYDPYATSLGGFCSPIIFFDPSGRMPRGRRHAIAQHTDIMPTLLGYVGTKRPFVAYGNDLLHKPDSDTWAINYLGGIYQYVEDGLMLQFDGERTRAIYDIQNDWMQTNNLVGHPRQHDMERRVKAIVQDYMERMNKDELTIVNNE